LDGSSDVLVQIARKAKIEIFRYNIDLFKAYEIICTKSQFTISDPEGRVVDVRSDGYKLLWRKPFLDLLLNEKSDTTFPILRGNLSSVLRTIIETARARGLISLVEPYADERLTKLKQLHDAAELFNVPDYVFSILENRFHQTEAITKALGGATSSDNKVLFTSKVAPSDLERPFPWFVQSAITGGKDITAVYIDGKTWFFECAYPRSEQNLDWRTEINTLGQSQWRPWKNGESIELQLRVEKLLKKWNLRYSRLDFILDNDNILWFLECNPNGQFGWLDDEDLNLHKAFLASSLK